MSSSIGGHAVIGGVFFSAYQLLRVEQMAVGTSAYLVDRLYHRQYVSPKLLQFSVHLLHTEGSRSTKIERGTYLPFPVSVKKVS
jgi:hypothetical protein